MRRLVREIVSADCTPPDTAKAAADMIGIEVTQDADRLDLDALDFVRWYQARDLQDQLPGDQHEAPDVVLMTVHASKGTEYDNVAVSASLMPLKGQDPEEERNIFYVAVTRAKRMLAVVGDGGFMRDV